MSHPDRWKLASAFLVLTHAMAPAAAQTFTTLVNFDGTNGADPAGALIQGVDGNYYGPTELGGSGCSSNCGTVFRIASGGALKTIYTFCLQSGCPDGNTPNEALLLGIDGNFYGTTSNGPIISSDEIFKLTPGGELTVFFQFGCYQGYCPFGASPSGLIQASDGNFYGTTITGISSGAGTIFKVTPSGKLTTLYSFCDLQDCAQTPFGGVIQAADGNFYGTTIAGGAGGSGTVYKLTPEGDFVVLHGFDGTDGVGPAAGLVQGLDGNLFGTTQTTIFKITLQGALTTLHTFTGEDTGSRAALIQATDGNFYGTTPGFAAGGKYGSVFRITAAGVFTTLHTFNGNDGEFPSGGLLQGTNGKFYGATREGGQSDGGTIFSLDMGLGLFVSLIRNPAKVGQAFGILGQGFNGTTSVTLDGARISFRVMSNTLIEATIPNGATTGYVVGTSPRGTLTSNVPFRVLPQVLSFSPPSGPAGSIVTITGVSLTQANGVGFGDDIGAHFTVNSDAQVTATVPSGAKTGPVGVRTLGGIGVSTAIFTVTP